MKTYWGLGIGDWGLGIGDWGLGKKHKTTKTNTQYPITKILENKKKYKK